MAQDWLADVRKYAADADEAVVGTIVRYCGIALQKQDSALVSFSDAKETGRVRENYLRKKLGLTHDDSALDAGIAAVGERMQADRTKNRVTVYYLLADHFDVLPIFGGTARAAGGIAAGAAGLAALSPTVAAAPADPPTPDYTPPPPPPPPPIYAPEAGGGGTVARPPAYAAAGAPASGYELGGGWLLALLGGIGLAAIAATVITNPARRPAAMDDYSPVQIAAAPATGATAAPAAADVPAGAGVIAAERDARPMLTVYFDTGKADLTNGFAAAAGPVKAWIEANPAATLAVSGFNDPTGNAAANAELSKNRAQTVKAALEGLGIPADKVLLEKPAETTGTGATNTESRRVEVVVKG